MAEKYELELNLDIPEKNIRGRNIKGLYPGELLEGELIIKPREEIKCRGVWLEIGFWDRGQGTPNENRLVESKIYEGNLYSGSPFIYKVTFQVPDRALPSYSGKIMSIDWFVRARIDVPMWFDKRHEVPFKVLPNVVSSPDEVDYTIADSLVRPDPMQSFTLIFETMKTQITKSRNK